MWDSKLGTFNLNLFPIQFKIQQSIQLSKLKASIFPLEEATRHHTSLRPAPKVGGGGVWWYGINGNVAAWRATRQEPQHHLALFSAEKRDSGGLIVREGGRHAVTGASQTTPVFPPPPTGAARQPGRAPHKGRGLNLDRWLFFMEPLSPPALPKVHAPEPQGALGSRQNAGATRVSQECPTRNSALAGPPNQPNWPGATLLDQRQSRNKLQHPIAASPSLTQIHQWANFGGWPTKSGKGTKDGSGSS